MSQLMSPRDLKYLNYLENIINGSLSIVEESERYLKEKDFKEDIVLNQTITLLNKEKEEGAPLLKEVIELDDVPDEEVTTTKTSSYPEPFPEELGTLPEITVKAVVDNKEEFTKQGDVVEKTTDKPTTTSSKEEREISPFEHTKLAFVGFFKQTWFQYLVVFLLVALGVAIYYWLR